ncbi:hypothetical protein CcrColossus_gp337 [Caulobacter phage CcrColossus]|uniref:Uncharacterized protein n=1 Tax=Caulobacter phage CcrColossus TaxID=1211640 RepID=K4K6K8_9CAUD|nr:hypothetical protein CcrColossus_gp337 [Caulobacter phage CcrColossus]AFU88207.1 hypothetical protein CcrColossus_gp337 [Caulobacter phage CcrColossus]
MLDIWVYGMIALTVFNIGCAFSQGWWSPNNSKLVLLTLVWPACCVGLIVLLFIMTTFTVMPASLKAAIEKYPLDLG